MSHVDEGQLHGWLDYGRSGMTEAEYIEVGAHLARCAECAALLAEERALRERAAAILGGTGPRATAAPSFDALVERARASGQLPGASPGLTGVISNDEGRDWSGRRTRRPVIGLAWAASVMAALGLGWAASTLIDPDQVAIQMDSALEESATSAPARETTLSREDITATTANDVVAPGAAAPPPAQFPAERSGPAAREAAAPPPAAPVDAGPEPQNGAASRGVAMEVAPQLDEVVVVGYSTQSRAADSAGVTPEEGQSDQAVAADVAEPAARVAAAGAARAPAAAEAGPNPAAAPAGPPPPAIAGIATPEALGYAAGPAVIWSVTTAEVAAQRLGRAVLIHPGFPLLRIETPADSGIRMVRVVQALPGGGNLTVTQTPVIEGQPAPAAPPGGSTIIRDGLVVTGIAPISTDSIGGLLDGLR